jgi:hypothetical protein
MAKKNMLALLAGGNRRSIGRADEVAAIVLKSPGLFSQVIAGLWSQDPVVRMRAADVAEKVTRKNRVVLRPYKKELLGLMHETGEKELRWHLAVLVPRLPLNAKERGMAIAALHHYLEDSSSIIRTFALQGLADLAQVEPELRSSVIEILQQSVRGGTRAMKARSRKLLLQLQRLSNEPK